MSVGVIAQIVTAAATIGYAAVIGVVYFKFLKLYRETLNEMRAGRAAADRPQVLVEADYGRLPEVDLVLKNVGPGTAKEITFGFSRNVESCDGFVLSVLPYFQGGVDFLGPGAEIRCYWDNLGDLIPALKVRGIEDGITVTVNQKDLGGKSYEDRWTLDPLLYEDNRNARPTGMGDLADAVHEVSRKLDAVVG